MKFFNILAITLVASLAQLAQGANEIALQYARLYQSDLSGSCEVCTTFSGIIEVKNIAYAKQVTVHYQTGFSNGWVSQAAQYIGPSRTGYEYWGFSSQQTGTSATFNLTYQVNGQTYRDTNNNGNYFVQTEAPLIANNNIQILLTRDQHMETRRFADHIGVLGSVHVRTNSTPKKVTIRYTTNGWRTWSETPARFNSTASNSLERWGFNLELPLDATQLELAASYEVNGVIHWDNNLNRNYRFPLPR